jgi:dATP pyrophosphohydrolase
MSTPIVRVIDLYPYRRRGEHAYFLLLRRAPGRIYAGSWRMVGGKIQKGEQAWQAAVRELWEETGREPIRFWSVPSVNAFYEWQQDRVNLCPAFAAEIDGDPQLDAEHDAFEWLSAEQAADRLAWPEQRRLVRLVAGMLASGIPGALEIPVGGSRPDSRA